MKKSSLLWSFLLLLAVALGYYFWNTHSTREEELPVTNVVSLAEETSLGDESWFRYAPADTLYRRHQYAYFCFVSVYFDGDVSTFTKDNDSTLFFSPEVALSRFPVLAHTVALPENTVSSMIPAGSRLAVYRVDTVVQGARSLRYRLKRGF